MRLLETFKESRANGGGVWRRVAPVFAAVVCATILVGVVIAIWPGSAPSSSPSSWPSAPTDAGAPSGGLPSPGSSASPPQANPTPPEESPPHSNGTSSNLTITLSLAKSMFAVGETVNYTVTVTNVATTSQFIPFGDCNPSLVVTNSSGVVVYNQAAGVCPLSITVLTLAPGQSFTLDLTWPQQTTVYGAQVPPGSYELTENWNAGYSGLLSASAAIDVAPN